MCAYRDASVPQWEILSDSLSSSAQSNEGSESERMGRAVNYPLPKRKAALPPVERPQKFARTDTSRRPGMPSVEPRAPSNLSNVLESRPSAASPSDMKRGKKKVVLTRRRELVHSLLRLAPAAGTSNGVPSRPRDAGTHSEVKRLGNPRDVIVLSSDDDTPSFGNASNPIVLDSDDEAESRPKAHVPAVASFLDAVQSMSPPSNSHMKSSTRSEVLAGPHSSPQRGSSPPMSSESEDGVLAVLTTAHGDNAVKEMSPLPGQTYKATTPEQPLPPPHPNTHPVMRVDSPSPSTHLITVEAKAKIQPTPQSPEYHPKAEVTTPQPEGERPSPLLSPSLMNSVPQIDGTSHSSTTTHVSVFSSPSRQRETPAGSPAGSPHVTVRGTLYSGPSGLWKNFFQAATAKPVSAPGSPRDILPQKEEQLKERSRALRAELPGNVVSLTRASLPSENPVGIKPGVVEPDSPGSSENSVTPNGKSKSSVFATDIRPPSQYGKSIDLPVIRYTPARTMLEFPQKVYYTRDIPHAVQDLMNTMDAHYRRSIMAKDMFEAVIIENTFEDEPNAPHISIINDVDGDQEVTPAWEFHYSNRIWHSDDVPPPDLVNLRGCDCEGHCDPKSLTCSCLKRQKEYSDDIPGFIYDEKGRLKRQGYPIFECNDLCGCLDDCRNRVIQRGRQYTVNIRKTTNKGWGIFAGRQKIPKGSFIGIYAGELLTERETEERGKIYNKVGKTYLFELDFYYLRKSAGDGAHGAQDDEEWQAKYVMDAYHAGNFTRFLNHSCDPNCAPNACYINEGNIDKPLVALFTRRDVLPWEELCFSYSGYESDDENEESENVRANNGDAVYAKCLCGAKRCTGFMFN